MATPISHVPNVSKTEISFTNPGFSVRTPSLWNVNKNKNNENTTEVKTLNQMRPPPSKNSIYLAHYYNKQQIQQSNERICNILFGFPVFSNFQATHQIQGLKPYTIGLAKIYTYIYPYIISSIRVHMHQYQYQYPIYTHTNKAKCSKINNASIVV